MVRAGMAAMLLAVAGPAWADVAGGQAAFDKAFGHFRAGDLRAARVELLNALKADPKNGPARLLFARVQLARGNGLAAQTEIERAITLGGVPREKTLHLTANALLLQQGKTSQALDLLTKNRVPPQFAAYAARMRGRAQFQLRNPAEGARELAEAVRLAPGSSAAWVDLARSQAGTTGLAEAVRSIDRAVSLDPGNVEALILKGGIVRQVRGPAAALPLYDRALGIDGNSIETMLERASTLAQLGRYDDARRDTKKILGLQPGYPLALYLDAAMLARQGKYDDAQRTLNATKGVMDRFPPAQLLRADIALKQGNLGQASDLLQSFVAQNPNNVTTRRALAEVQLKRGDPRGALATLEPLVKNPRIDAGALAMLGTASAQVGDFKAAGEYLTRAKALAPKVAALDTQLAMVRMAQGDGRGAITGLNGVLAKDPTNAQALSSLAYAQLRTGNYKAAVATADRLVARSPDAPLGYYIRGVARTGGRDAKGAEADLRAAVAKNAKFLDARRALAQLLFATGRPDPAKAELRAVIADAPGDTASLLLLADFAGRAGAAGERVDWLKRAVLSQPTNLGARAALVQAYLGANQPRPALDEASALVRDRPDDVVPLQLLAGAQLANKDQRGAEATARRIVVKAPGAAGAKVLLARVQATGGPQGIVSARGTLAEAIAGGGAGASAAGLAMVQLELSQRNFPAAVAAAERLRGLTTEKLAADKLLGDTLMAAGRPADALPVYQRVRAGANNALTHAMVARAQAASGQQGAALATLRAYRAANPRDVAGGLTLADQYIAMKDWRQAIATYQSLAGTVAARSPVALNNLAYAYGEVGDPRAVAAAARANQLAPNMPTVMDTYAWVLMRRGQDPARALALMQAAVRGEPNNPNFRHHLGLALKANGKRADAARELRAALAAQGLDDAPGARAALAGL